MKQAVIVDGDDIKKMLADYFGLPEENVLEAQEFYAIITEKEKDNEDEMQR